MTKEPFGYVIDREAIQPNTDGRKRTNVTVTMDVSMNESANLSMNAYIPPVPPGTHIQMVESETIQFYEGRVADLERMLESYEDMPDQIDELEADLEETQDLLERSREQLNQRNIEMMAMTTRLVETEKKSKRLEMEVEAAKRELEDFKYTRASTEVMRLANEINRLQSDSYYKNLSRDSEIDKDQIILMLVGMTTEFKKIQIEKDRMEKEMIKLRVHCEKIERERDRERIKERERVNREREDALVYDDDETDLETDHSHTGDHSQISPPKSNPFFMSSSTSKMVPKAIPKALKPQHGTVSTGTGKKLKIMQFSNGQKHFIG